MLAQASVIKRPVVQWSADTADISVGFDPEAWNQRI
jgi:arsenate reductase-like glutaredoxin family protein